MKLFIARDKSDLERCFPIMHELRTNLQMHDFLSLYDSAHKNDGYEIVALEENNKILAVMGYRILYDLVHGKHLYIDDLVSTESQRSKGLGAQLLNYAEVTAKNLNCTGLRLCTGIENELGKKFYEKHNWQMRAIVYKKSLKMDGTK